MGAGRAKAAAAAPQSPLLGAPAAWPQGMTCESCGISECEVEEPVGNGQHAPYRLCRPCHERLLNLSLRPLEFFRLAAIHGHTYHLHDDFYDDGNGEAMQPRDAVVVDAERFPFPVLDDIKGDLRTLVDYACVQYTIADRVIALLKAHDQAALLAYLVHKTRYSRAIHYQTYPIAARVLATAAGEWIREEWENRRENEVWIFAEAVSRCLPPAEAFNMLSTEIEKSSGRQLAGQIGALRYLESAKALDWIERMAPRIVNVSTDWGVLAAVSQFSWPRAESWLTMGRPLSLVALDALMYCTCPEHSNHPIFWFRQRPPILVEAAPVAIMANRLTAYLEMDKAPRTRGTVAVIIDNLFA